MYIKNFVPSMKRWPAIIPHGEYVIAANIFTIRNEKNENLGDVKMYADVKTIR